MLVTEDAVRKLLDEFPYDSRPFKGIRNTIFFSSSGLLKQIIQVLDGSDTYFQQVTI